jgi:hypothetical protein
MKMGEGADHLWLILKHDTTLDWCGFEVIEGLEGGIGDAFIGQRPQPLARLQFGGIGWQEEQVDPLGDHEFTAGMPPSSIEHEQNALGGTRSDSLSPRGRVRW